MKQDYELALELEAMSGNETFPDLLRHYWSRQEDVDSKLVERFVVGDLIGEDRAHDVADQIDQMAGGIGDGMVLEVGSGTAALGTVLAGRARRVVVTDISLAWLVLARKRLVNADVQNVDLVACAADRLPFAREEFDLVVAADVIEHVPDHVATISEAYQVLRRGGTFWLSTPNRYSLTPEPHVRLFGVGWMPHRLARRYVRRMRSTDYTSIHMVSLRRLKAMLQSTGGTVRIVAPGIAGALRERYPVLMRLAIDLYDLARRVPILDRAVLLVTPLFHAVVRKPADASADRVAAAPAARP